MMNVIDYKNIFEWVNGKEKEKKRTQKLTDEKLYVEEE